MSGRAWLVQTMRKGKNLYANASRLLLLIKIYIFFLRVDKDIHCSFIQQTCSCRVGIACTLYTITDRKVQLHLLGKWKCSRSPSTAWERRRTNTWGKVNTQTENVEHHRTTDKISPGSEYEQSKNMFFNAKKFNLLRQEKKRAKDNRGTKVPSVLCLWQWMLLSYSAVQTHILYSPW